MDTQFSIRQPDGHGILSLGQRLLRILPVFAFLFIFAILLSPVSAQPMVDQVPPDAIVYVGWTSGQGLKEAYANSHLKKLIDDSNLPLLLDDFLPKVFAKVGPSRSYAVEARQRAADIIRILLHHPAALYFEGLDLTHRARPMPRLGLVCDAGDDADQLQKDLSVLNSQKEVQIQRTRDRVSLRFAAPTSQPATSPTTQTASNLRFHKPFATALAQVHSEPATIFYVDVPRLLKEVDHALQQNQNPRIQSIWTEAVNLIGLRGVRQAIWTGDFEGADWGRRCFIAAPAPRKGLIALLAGQPLSDDLLKAIPPTASMVAAGGLDAAQWFDEIRSAIGRIDPQLQARFDRALQSMQTQSGVDLKNDLLSALGPDWAEYLDSSTGGTNFLGVTWLNRLHDPAKAQASLLKLETWLNQWIAQKLAISEIHIQFQQAELHGIKVHYLAAPAFAPAWTIADGRLYFSLYPEITAAAVRAAHGKNSILDNVSFTSLRSRLTPLSGQPLTAVAFADLPQFAPHTYASWLMLSRFAGLSDLFGIQSPLQIIPPLATIMNELSPAASLSWTDNAGLHSRSLVPFPGSELFMIDINANLRQLRPLMTEFPRFAAGRPNVAAPAKSESPLATLASTHARARTVANHVKSARNLRQIGMGIVMYSNDHRGQIPQTLGQLWEEHYIEKTATFFRPDTQQSVPIELKNDRPAMAKWIDAQSDYVYLPLAEETESSNPKAIAAYERFDPGSDGVNAMCADGSVYWLTIAELEQRLHQNSGKPEALKK
jgi:hypothetical protein